MSGLELNGNGGLVIKKLECPIHGITEHYFTSTIPGHEGTWCQLCWLKALDLLGVHRMLVVPR